MVSETVYGKLGKWVNKPLAKLPRELQPIVTAYIPKWQTLTPKQRTDRAIEVDRQRGIKSKLRYDRAVRAQQAARDPVEDAYWWDMLTQINDKKNDIEKWEAMPEPLPSEALAKAQRLHTLRGELAALETKCKAPYHGTQPAPAQTPAPVVTAIDAMPWLLIDPRDPPIAPHKDQPWYTPARYFARQLVVRDSTLLTKKLVLADMVSTSLAGAGIYKRGGKKAHSADTVLKAFANVTLG